MTVLGIDPGLAETGWGVIDAAGSRSKALGWGVLPTRADATPGARLEELFQQFNKLLKQWRPQLCGIETLFFSKNVSSALPVAQARGVILLALELEGVPTQEFAPNQIKKTVTGIAQAEKEQVQAMMKVLLGLDSIPNPNHAADALAAAFCARQFQGGGFVS